MNREQLDLILPPDSGMERIPVWLDCDPGHDDAFAILLAAYHPALNLLGISTVHGNSSVAHTTQNAASLLTAIGKTNIPLFAGAANGLQRPSVHAPAIHGESGLDGTTLLPKPTTPPRDGPAIGAIASALLSTPPRSAWLIATGALTNIAQVFSAYPHLASHIKGLSIMGGAVGGGFTDAVMGKVDNRERIGNWSVWAEFNILADPEAAEIIFQNETLQGKTVLIPLDVTHLVLATKEVQSLLLFGKEAPGETNGKSSLRIMLVELLTYFANTYVEVFGITKGPPLHDPLAVAVILDGVAGSQIPFCDFKPGEDRQRRERYEVRVVTQGTHAEARLGAETGRTVVKLLPEGSEGVKIPRSLNVERFWTVLEDCLERADEANRANGSR